MRPPRARIRGAAWQGLSALSTCSYSSGVVVGEVRACTYAKQSSAPAAIGLPEYLSRAAHANRSCVTKFGAPVCAQMVEDTGACVRRVPWMDDD